ncbi:MAG: UDP-3-O-acyl-N-acetylglucosamine deacetylase [Chlamydiota bacterium]
MTDNYGMGRRAQQTLRNPQEFTGIGLHTGRSVTIRFVPAPANTGIIFRRTDLPGQPEIPARLAYVQKTPRCTVIGTEEASIYTVEHLMAAFSAYKIDNLYIDIDAPEPPVADGSAKEFGRMIEASGIAPQDEPRHCMTLEAPCYWSEGYTHLVAIPYKGYKISYTLDYPDSKLIGSQYLSLDITSENFIEHIAPCRTFAKHEEIAALQSQGLIKGGSLNNAVVTQGESVLNPEGLRFSNEMVRHKILDLIGDLALTGVDFQAHIIAVCSGHASNVAFGKILLEHLANKE